MAFIQKHLPDPFHLEGTDRISIRDAIFREIHRADELGSGMRNMMRYGKAYGGEDPQMIEGDVFRIIVKVPEFSAFEEYGEKEASGEVTPQATPQVTGEGCPVGALSGPSWGPSHKEYLMPLPMSLFLLRGWQMHSG